MPTASQISQATTVSMDVAEFDDNDPKHMVLGCVHCKYAMLVLCVVGLAGVLTTFSYCVGQFRWDKDPTMNVTTGLGLGIFLVSGVFAHLTAMFAAKMRNPSLIMPYVVLHVFLIMVELTMALTAIGELVTDDEPQVDESDIFARNILEIVPFTMALSTLMLCVGMRYKKYFRLRMESAHSMHSVVTPVFFCDNAATSLDPDKLDECSQVK